jgi:hypothetical protein
VAAPFVGPWGALTPRLGWLKAQSRWFGRACSGINAAHAGREMDMAGEWLYTCHADSSGLIAVCKYLFCWKQGMMVFLRCLPARKISPARSVEGVRPILGGVDYLFGDGSHLLRPGALRRMWVPRTRCGVLKLARAQRSRRGGAFFADWRKVLWRIPCVSGAESYLSF